MADRLEPGSAAVTALGMVTCLGLDAATSCASARAGLSRKAAGSGFEVWNEEEAELEPVAVHPVPLIGEGFTGLGRLVRLLLAALEDLRTHPGKGKPGPSLPIFLALPGPYLSAAAEDLEEVEALGKASGLDPVHPSSFTAEELESACREDLFRLLETQGGLTFHPSHRRLYFRGETGFHLALSDALEYLAAEPAGACLVGGADCLIEEATLQGLHSLGILKSVQSPAGFIPGEAACLLRLENAEAARTAKREILGRIRGLAAAREAEHRFGDKPSLGRALAKAITGARGPEPEGSRPVGLLIGNHNGDDWRAKEWGQAQVRLPRPLLDAREWYPAEHFGEVGAAMGPAAMAMAIRGWARGYAPPGDAVIWLSGYDGSKAAVAMAAGGGR